MELQAKANDALTKIEEKTQFIQTQVGGMFDKTLDAAIGKRELLSENFEQINEKLEEAQAKVVEESIKKIGAAGEQERNRLAKNVEGYFADLRKTINKTQESAKEAVAPIFSGTLIDAQEKVLSAINRSQQSGTSEKEIISRLDVTGISLFTIKFIIELLRLKGQITEKKGRYFPVNKS
jgi:TATA-binding protein-associated factor Taf7